MKNRIKKIRKELDLTQQAFADKLGVKRNNIAGYETGSRCPSDAVISLICREFNVNETWLREGTGEIFINKTQNEQIVEWVKNVLNDTESSFKKYFITTLMHLKDNEWNFLEKIMQKIINEVNKEKL